MFEFILNKIIGIVVFMFAMEMFGFPVLRKPIHWIKQKLLQEQT